jgi:hypothetical protein
MTRPSDRDHVVGKVAVVQAATARQDKIAAPFRIIDVQT